MKFIPQLAGLLALAALSTSASAQNRITVIVPLKLNKFNSVPTPLVQIGLQKPFRVMLNAKRQIQLTSSSGAILAMLSEPVPIDEPFVATFTYDGAQGSVWINGDPQSQITKLGYTWSGDATVVADRSGVATFGKIGVFSRLFAHAQRYVYETQYSRSLGVEMQTTYASTVRGSDRNSGVFAATPKADVQNAVNYRLATGGGSVRVEAPANDPYRGQVTVGRGSSIVLAGYGELPWYVQPSNRYVSGFREVGNGIYRKHVAVSNYVGVIWNEATLNGDGQPTPLYRMAVDSPTVPEGRFSLVDGYLYVHLKDNVSPNGQAIEVSKAACAVRIWNGSGSPVVIKNAHMRGGYNACLEVGFKKIGGRVDASGCTAQYGTNGFGSREVYCESRFTNCEARYNANDGFNLHAIETVSSPMTMIDCISRWNFDEGASPHGNTRMYVYGGEYTDNGQAGFHAIRTSTMELTDVLIERNNVSRVSTNYGGVSFNNDSKGKVENCTIRYNQGPGYWRLHPANAPINGATISFGNRFADQ
ncbi:right-handed parallel beta-helix repeat-containing protein [bacterium]|nr:MAG: right-handed parallel beta-helix repeat-containing protein [bacterium]